jgi:hypothetical protein
VSTAFFPKNGIEVKEGYLDDIDGLIIGEPTDNGVFYAHKGSMACKIELCAAIPVAVTLHAIEPLCA